MNEDAVLQPDGDGTDRWSSFPVPAPSRFLLPLPKLRRTFATASRKRLDQQQEAFERFVAVPQPDRQAELDSAVRPRIAMIVRLDTIRDVIVDHIPFPTWGVVVVLTGLTTPFLLRGDPHPSALVPGLLGIVIAAVVALLLLFAIPTVGELLTGRDGAEDKALVCLALLAMSVGGLWAVMSLQPFGHESYSAAFAALVGLFTVWFLSVHLVPSTIAVALQRIKLAADPEAEIIDALLATLYRTFVERPVDDLAGRPAAFRVAAEDLQYVALVIDRRWSDLVPRSPSTVVRGRWKDVMSQAAAALRALGSRAAFPDPHFERDLLDGLTTEVTAFALGDYGRLLVAPTDREDSVKPRLVRLVRAVGRIGAAVAPITVLLVAPRLIGISLDDGLFGTLLTVALAWLSLHAITWLDPKSDRRIAALPGLAAMMRTTG